MSASVIRALLSGACLFWLAACSQTTAEYSATSYVDANGTPVSLEPRPLEQPVIQNATYVSDGPQSPVLPETPLMGDDQHDELSLGKKHFRARDFGLAERHFRRAVELSPRDAEAWLGLAASYDRLRRFDEADRAYRQALAIVGPVPEVLNNQGYSYLLRGNYRRARQKFLAAQAKDPENPRIRHNIEVMEASLSQGRGVAAQ